ncbi:7 transmembrane receptor, partial [Opisthorchis viverrini]
MNYSECAVCNLSVAAAYFNDPAFAKIVLPHWYMHAAPSPGYFYLFGVFASIVGISSITLNSFIILAFSLNGFARKTRHWFTVNLAVADLGLTISCCFPMKVISMFQRKWIWGKVGCDFYGFAGGLFGFTSITTLATIAYLRYWTIAHAQPWSYAVTNRNATYALLLIWLWSTLWTILPFFGIGRYVMEGFLTGCTFDYLSNDRSSIIFSSCLFLGGFVCPFALICFSYARILWLIRKSKQSLYQPEKVNKKICGSPTAYRKVSFRTVKTTSVLISMYLVAWGPYAVVTLLSVFGYRNHLTPIGTELPGLFAKTSALYNPIVYVVRNGSFRKMVAKRRQRSQLTALKQTVNLSVLFFLYVLSLRRNSSTSPSIWHIRGSKRINQQYSLLYQMRETRAPVTNQLVISVFSEGINAIGCHTYQPQEAFRPTQKSPADCLHDANVRAKN